MESHFLVAQDSCDTLGASWTTDDCGGEEDWDMRNDHTRPRSPRTPQAQIVKNNFKVSYRRVVTSGPGGKQAPVMSYHSEFISPEILRDGRHGLFTHFEGPHRLPEDQRQAMLSRTQDQEALASVPSQKKTSTTSAICPPSTSPKQGECFIRTTNTTNASSPAVRMRKLRLSFRDANAMAYYGTNGSLGSRQVAVGEDSTSPSPWHPRPPAMSSVRGREGGNDSVQRGSAGSAKSDVEEAVVATSASMPKTTTTTRSATRREVRGKLSFAPTPLAQPDLPGDTTENDMPTAAASQEDLLSGSTNAISSTGQDKHAVGSPVSVIDMDRPSSLCCELCGQNLDEQALAKICKIAIPHLQSRGRYLSTEATSGQNRETLLETIEPLIAPTQLEVVEEEERKDEGVLKDCDANTFLSHPLHSVGILPPNMAYKRRSRAQKKIWRSIRNQEQHNTTRGVAHGLTSSPIGSIGGSSYHMDMLQQDLAKKLDKLRLGYTPVKDLIYHNTNKASVTKESSRSQKNHISSLHSHSYVDINAATFLFASQMKLTLNGG